MFRPKSLLSFILAFSSFSSSAWAQATFGAEFNFTNDLIDRTAQGSYVNSPESEAARDRMMKAVRNACANCYIQAKENGYGVKTYRVTYPDGWYFDIATDPAVVEVQTKPSTVAEIKLYQDRIQKHIFDTAASVDLLPASEIMGTHWAGSHIHIGAVSALGDGVAAVKLLKNFMVDFSNHPELAMGIFSADRANAPPLGMLPQAQRDAFAQICADVDAGKIRSINTFARRVRKEVYNVTIMQDWAPSTKYQAFNVNRIGDRAFDLLIQTFEIRAMRGQESSLDFLIQTELLEARIKHIQSLGKSIEVKIPNVYMSEEAKAEAFYKYVTETGLAFDPYVKFLTPAQRVFLPGIIARTPSLCRRIF
ncbi:hypothetical protein AZI86_00420 [Bdellovibrio bacteriovorus]|uniref:Uncharacterized protein n=1 Tax=Bdellovibrio bacteriovorus TaxID=959 RepID=A0A150WMR6_BDEBC|nr:hypothetical protein [Bdellovibrio bacteriovorus]KYG65579.1 hypothetical protein AZI86_00420 [Bdellovibrio bacteriovorus]